MPSQRPIRSPDVNVFQIVSGACGKPEPSASDAHVVQEVHADAAQPKAWPRVHTSELDALNSSGASAARLLRPVYGLVICLVIFDFLLVSYIQPFAGYKYQQIRFDVTSGALGIKIP